MFSVLRSKAQAEVAPVCASAPSLPQFSDFLQTQVSYPVAGGKLTTVGATEWTKLRWDSDQWKPSLSIQTTPFQLTVVLCCHLSQELPPVSN